mmetsp:Transcript_15790/g.24039  ORF Transcript_15790/g.24039 Transcript_15790/m.24039 type:complete len:135 (+) Transcript_15790:348-752(+)
MYFGQYFRFSMSVAAKTPHFRSSTIPRRTQKPESNTTILPVPHKGLVRRRSSPTVLSRLLNWGRAASLEILAFHQLHLKHHFRMATSNSVPFIPKQPRLSGYEHKAWTSELGHPRAHRLIKASTSWFIGANGSL